MKSRTAYCCADGRAPSCHHAWRISLAVLLCATASVSAAPATPPAATGPVDLLALINPAEDAVSGKWVMQGGVLRSPHQRDSKLSLPVTVQGDYRLRVAFHRTAGKLNTVILLLPVGSANVAFYLDGWGGDGGRSGLSRVDGQTAKKNATTVRGLHIKTGRKHVLVADVSTQGDSASITVTLDDKPLVRWQGRQAQLTTGTSPRDKQVPALATTWHPFSFDAIELEMRTGQARLMRNERVVQGAAPASRPAPPTGGATTPGVVLRPNPATTPAPPAPVAQVDDNQIERPEWANRTKNLVKPIVSSNALMVRQLPSGEDVGFNTEIILAATRFNNGMVVFKGSVGRTMRTALEEATRAVRLRYPMWDRRQLDISFGDKYSYKDGGSAGAACAMLLLAALEGIDLDPKFAVTGDILVNWKIKPVGAVAAKVRGAAVDKVPYVAIPSANVNALPDMMLLAPKETLWQTQVFSVPDLQSLVRLVRTNRPAQVTEAMKLFTEVQAGLNARGEALLLQPTTKEKLEKVVELAPNHESARHLLLICNRQKPTRLSRGGSLRRIFVVTRPLHDLFWKGHRFSRNSLPKSTAKNIQLDLRRLQLICHKDLLPVVAGFQQFNTAADRWADRPTRDSFERLNKQRQELIERFRQLQADRDTMERVYREAG